MQMVFTDRPRSEAWTGRLSRTGKLRPAGRPRASRGHGESVGTPATDRYLPVSKSSVLRRPE